MHVCACVCVCVYVTKFNCSKLHVESHVPAFTNTLTHTRMQASTQKDEGHEGGVNATCLR